jgi:hypothetical protein
VAGISGGVVYFSSASTWASSAALAANALVVGGGAGVAPSTITTGTGVVTALGVNTGSAGAFVVNGGALGTPSSGTVTNLTGTASININGTVGATTPDTGAFTTLSATGVTTVQAGTAALPAITTSGDTDTGIFFPAANTIAFTKNGAESMRINSSGNVGIGTTTISDVLTVAGAIGSRVDTNATANLLIINSNAGSSAKARFRLASDVVVGNLQANSSTATPQLALIVEGAYPLTFLTTNTERMRIDSSGNVIVTGVGGLGYGTGSGGTVTQVTSRTTGVTLNKTNGAITLVSAAGMAVFQSFTVTNSTVAATDVVHVTQKSGTDLYQIFVTATAAGSFRITFATTGGVTVEQPVFNFAVIKGVTA